MPDLDLSEGRRLLEAASDRPWNVHEQTTRKLIEDPNTFTVAEVRDVPKGTPDHDADLIVWAINSLPALLDTAEKVKKVEEYLSLLALHPTDNYAQSVYGNVVAAHVASILQGDTE